MRKMMMLVTMLISTIASFAQNQNKISGTVIDGSQKTIESATISLLRAKDSVAAKFTVAGKEGKFSFENVPAGKYMVSISAVGHKKAFSPVFEVSDAQPAIILNTIELTPVEKSMSGVTITARKPLIEQKIDRTVVNVDASITNVGTSALEVLEKSPGITVDKDGNISLKGKQGVVVLVDGRPTQLGAADLANMLRSMQSSGLEQIEIMTNPPAKYDAAGNAGVINIKTKRNKQMGYSGSVGVNVTQAIYTRTSENASLAYKHNKVNLYGNFSHNYWKGLQDLRIQRNFLNPSKEVVNRFEQQSDLLNSRHSFNGKIGMDYSLSKKTTIGAVVSGFSTPSSFIGTTVTNNLVGGRLNDVTRSISDNREKFRNLSTNLNLRHVFDSTGKELTADVDYVVYDGNTNLELRTNFNDHSDQLRTRDTLQGRLPQNIKIYSGKVDYTHPLKKGGRLEAGVKSSLVRTDNDAVYEKVKNGVITRDNGRSNHFIYEENINAAYVNASLLLSKKWNAQVGLRLEHTNATGHSMGYQLDTTFKNNYAQLFPTAYLQYKASDKNSFVLNYGRRIRRPNYESLNPFIEFIDIYTFQQGNPNLKPQFSHNIELSHTFKGFLTTTLNYTTTNDIIQQVVKQKTATSETFIEQANIASQKQYGIAVSAGLPINKWWTANMYVNVSDNRFKGLVNNTMVDVGTTIISLNGSHQFKLGKTTSAELNGWFRGPALEGVVAIRTVGMFSLGLSQQIMKNKGTLRLTVRDVMSTQHWKGTIKYGDVDAQFQNFNDSRAVTLGFTYRFSKGKVGQQRRKAAASSDEQSRVGGSN
jgi:iron complex outermembrane recepter protein